MKFTSLTYFFVIKSCTKLSRYLKKSVAT